VKLINLHMPDDAFYNNRSIPLLDISRNRQQEVILC